MKSRKFFAAIAIISFALIAACSKNNAEADYTGQKLLAERIQYDVLIKTPDPELDWWVQNIEGSKRESFVKTFLNLAYEGKVRTFDYFNKPLTSEEVKKIDNYTDTLIISEENPPYKICTTIVKHELNIQSITKARFMEEWYYDEKNSLFNKKVVGMMLMKESYGDSAEIRGYTPLFWIYFDKNYPEKLK